MRHVDWRAVVTLGALLLLLAGCGDEKTLTKSEWIAEAEVICARAGKALDELDPDNFDSQKEFARAAVDVFGDYLADLRALTAPPGDQATITRWLDLQEELAEAWGSFLASAGGETATEVFVETAEPISKRADRLIRRFGADGCAVNITAG
jgi:hypothetical protein